MLHFIIIGSVVVGMSVSFPIGKILYDDENMFPFLALSQRQTNMADQALKNATGQALAAM